MPLRLIFCHATGDTCRVISAFSSSPTQLWSRDVEQDILPTCIELGIGFVAYSPLGRGYLSGKLNTVNDLDKNDFRRALPRFESKNIETNNVILEGLLRIAKEVNATPSQLAIAWLLNKHESIVPIPGTKRLEYLEENTAASFISLSPVQMVTLDLLFSSSSVAGQRYSELGMTSIQS